MTIVEIDTLKSLPAVENYAVFSNRFRTKDVVANKIDTLLI